MKSPVVKRSIVIAGHKTSVSLEDAFWKGLKEIAAERGVTLSELVASIDSDRRHGNLSSAIRLFVLDHYRNQINEDVADHSATRELCQQLAKEGNEIVEIEVDQRGALDFDQLETAVNEDTALVSIMWANNETGVLFPIVNETV